MLSLARRISRPVQVGLFSSWRAASFKVQDTADFEQRVKKSKIPVVIDFYATWCNPCRMLTPRIESVIAENEGKITLAKVDIDENSDLALDYGVGSVPVLLIMNNGKAEQRLVGLQDTDMLRNWISKVISDSEKGQSANS